VDRLTPSPDSGQAISWASAFKPAPHSPAVAALATALTTATVTVANLSSANRRRFVIEGVGLDEISGARGSDVAIASPLAVRVLLLRSTSPRYPDC
jgi:hypothetical protein